MKFALPACVAVIVQVPAVSAVTVLPVIEQTVAVALASVTGSPEVAVALTVAVPPLTNVGAVPKAML